MSRSLIIDPRSERAANAPLEIFRDPAQGPGVYVTDHRYPRPDVEMRQVQLREGKRSSGAPILGNRQIPLELFILGRRASYAADLVNLLTNPGFEIDLTQWSTASSFAIAAGATATREISDSYSGEAVAKIVTGAVLFQGIAYNPGAAVVNATTYKAIARVKGTPGENIQFFVGSAAVGNASATVTFDGTWQRVELTFTATGTGACLFSFRTLSAAARTFWIDACAFWTNVPDSFDGDSPGCSWSGTAHASTSTQPGDPEICFEAMVADVEEKLWKLQNEGGSYSRPFEAGRLVFDVDTLAGGDDGAYDGRRWIQQGQKIKATLDCLPHGRGATETGSLQTQTTDPVCVWLESAVGGNVRALGEMEIVDTAAKDRRGFVAAVEQPNYDHTPATAALQLLAKDLTLLGSAALQARTGSHGVNTVKATLNPNWTAYLSTKIAASGLHLTMWVHSALWGRVYAPTPLSGGVSCRLEWGQGDLLSREALQVDIVEQRNGFYLIDFGTVRIEKAKVGTQRWEARWLAKSTVAGDTLELDDLRIVPLDFASAKVSRPVRMLTPTVFTARDEFDQTAGNLDAPKAAPTGGNWAEAVRVGANGFQTSGAGLLTRTTVSDADLNSGCYATIASAVAACAVRADVKFSVVTGSGVQYLGLLARYIDQNNWLFAAIFPGIAALFGGAVTLVKRVAGTLTVLGVTPISMALAQPNTYYGLQVVVEASGAYALWYGRGGPADTLAVVGSDPVLATGGALASGKVGLYDVQSAATACTRTYDNFASWAPTPDAAIFAGRKLRWRHDGIHREDSGGGGMWSPLGDAEADPLLLPPGGREKRILRAIAFPTRGDLDQLADGLATAGSGESDDFTAQLTRIARYVNVRK